MANNPILKVCIGIYKGVEIEVVTWDGTTAEVEMSCGCLFEQEINTSKPVGGLEHLDNALNNQLITLRQEGFFKGKYLETMLIDQKNPKVYAEKILLIGMGNPGIWSPEISMGAVGTAASLAYQMQIKSVAFAPSILDTGIHPTEDFSLDMLSALMKRIDLQETLFSRKLVNSLSLQRWVFDAGYQDFDTKVQTFTENFEKLRKL